jgi:hypothetical protein
VTFIGGAEQYIQAIPLSQWISALSTPKLLIPPLEGAAVAGVAALLTQALLRFKQWASTLPVPVVVTGPNNTMTPPEGNLPSVPPQGPQT